jgi:hypothetical protein
LLTISPGVQNPPIRTEPGVRKTFTRKYLSIVRSIATSPGTEQFRSTSALRQCPENELGTAVPRSEIIEIVGEMVFPDEAMEFDVSFVFVRLDVFFRLCFRLVLERFPFRNAIFRFQETMEITRFFAGIDNPTI